MIRMTNKLFRVNKTNDERNYTMMHTWRIAVHGLVATLGTLGVVAVLMVLLLPRSDVTAPACGLIDYGPFLVRSVCLGLVTALITTFGMAGIVRAVYGGSYVGPAHSGKHYRFGSEAEWRIKPTEKSSKHS